ncbi:MAG: putative lipid II flippase FtsW [Acholeplasmataceae bacterium]|nr:putative lipid II flippase FtsW [Acholeplasmataceae bacterium]HOA64192.1 putative lipid II flippase FtsW [Bacilli bacterium]HQA20153.1 putative lipid II flippase FtsW [Bacilli bacterium]
MPRRGIDWYLLCGVVLLSLIGLIMVYSASNVIALERYHDSFYFFKRQLLFLIIGYILGYFVIKANIINYHKYVTIVFLFCLGLLILVLIPGIGVVRGGARSWIGLGGLTIQPSEFIKIALIGLLAKYLSENNEDLFKFKYFIAIFVFVIIIFLIIMLQPDFGTGLVIVISCVLLLFCSGAPLEYFIFIIIIGLIGSIILIISEPYRLMRIFAFLDPWKDPLGSGFQGIQSLFAISPGGLFGHGFNKSMQKHFFLPEPQNDFIFAILIEEMGLIGGTIVLLLYFFTLYRGVKISLSVEDRFLKFLSIGIVILLFVQIFINVGVVIGLLPVTGITLPLFSYGGSSLVISIVEYAMLISISKYRNYDFL